MAFYGASEAMKEKRLEALGVGETYFGAKYIKG
jgi:hypothetical protein